MERFDQAGFGDQKQANASVEHKIKWPLFVDKYFDNDKVFNETEGRAFLLPAIPKVKLTVGALTDQQYDQCQYGSAKIIRVAAFQIKVIDCISSYLCFMNKSMAIVINPKDLQRRHALSG